MPVRSRFGATVGLRAKIKFRIKIQIRGKMKARAIGRV